MNPDCGILNPLQRDGTSQNHRLVHALHPSYVSVDERDLAALLRYAREYAALLRYYKTASNAADGNWRDFIENDISTLVAMIAGTRMEGLRKAYLQAVAVMEAADNPADKRNALDPLFSMVETHTLTLDSWYRNSIEGLSLEVALKKLINSVLGPTLQKTRAHLKRLAELGDPATDLSLTGLHSTWNLASFSSLQPDAVLYPSGTLTDLEEIEAAGEKLARQVQTFLDGMASIVGKAPEFLAETLEKYPEHQPHIALFLTFLQLFKHAQNHLNTLTRKHLNYYYQEVLQMGLREAQADEVHMIFELAKNFSSHRLEQGLELKAGKDDNKAEMYFATDEELIVNMAQLDEEDGLKTVFVEKEYGKDEEEKTDYSTYVVKNIYGAPVANSADGEGADIEDEEGKWLTMGGTEMPYARVGFALASPMFLLKEATRTITLTFTFENQGSIVFENGTDGDQVIAHELKHNLKVFFSGEKEWIEAAIDSVTVQKLAGKKVKMILKIVLDGNVDPVLPYSEKALKEGLDTTHPVMKVVFDNEGLSAEYLKPCMHISYLKTEADAASLHPVMARRILAFFNGAANEAAIAGREPQEGPIQDSPDTGSEPSNFPTGYDIGEVVAQRLIQRRNALKSSNGVGFVDVMQIMNVAGFGVDKMNDVIYTLCKAHFNESVITSVKEQASDYDPETEYQVGEFVRYEGAYYQALAQVKNFRPREDSDKWMHLPFSYPYKYFQHLEMQKLDIQVAVKGMKNLVLENDQGTINPAKPFFPFGTQPKAGSAFYIGSHEVFQKRLKGTTEPEVALHLTWADLPDGKSFNKYYIRYISKPATLNDNYFTIAVQVLKDGVFSPVSGKTSVSLFASNTADAQAPTPNSPISLQNILTDRDPELEDFAAYKVSHRRGFMRLVLNKDFFHKNYGASLTNSAISLASSELPDVLPPENEPYTPTLSSFELDYAALENWELEKQDLRKYDERIEQFFHLHPFGQREFFPVKGESNSDEIVVSRKLVPEFKVTYKDPETELVGERDAEGTLYIGLKGLKPAQNLSILIQVAEGSADPQAEPQTVVWSYLSYDRWVDFDTTEVLADNTNGLLTSGIVKLAMPKTMSSDNSSLKNGLHWIKASVAQQTNAVCQAIAVMPQAVKATFIKGEGNDLNRLIEPLEAETISKLKVRQAAIKTLTQPFASFNGKVKEQNEAPEGVSGDDLLNKEYNEFYIRVSERLRHKGRGITIFDYERLVLQRFPDVYKVKCVNHTSLDSEHAPGHVKLVVLPNLRNKNAVNPLQPMVDLNTLSEIKSYLKGIVSDFVTLEVKNPDYEEVKVKFNVKFREGVDQGYYAAQLNRDIVRFLSPWLFDEGEDLVLGGRIHRSWIINYIEELSYVDFLTDFEMKQLREGEDFETAPAVEEARASTSSSVLVSASEHIVEFNINVECLNPSS